MPTATKLVPPGTGPLDPQVKSWIDNVIVPTLVREFLSSQKARAESLTCAVPVVQCVAVNASPEGVK
jgi:hypothetical protein